MSDGSNNSVSTEITWTFLSNHAHVLLCVAREPEIRLRDIADRVGITERAVQRIVVDLETARYLERARSGRRNHYEIHPELPLRHPMAAHRDVGALLALMLEPRPASRKSRAARPAEKPKKPAAKRSVTRGRTVAKKVAAAGNARRTRRARAARIR